MIMVKVSSLDAFLILGHLNLVLISVGLYIGGTFALYTLLCRHAKFSLLPNQQAVDEELSTYHKHGHVTCGEISSPLKRFLEKHKKSRTCLLLVVLFGASMVIGGGVLTPAISGMCPMIMFPCVHLKRRVLQM